MAKKKKAKKKSVKKRRAAKRELVDTGRDRVRPPRQ